MKGIKIQLKNTTAFYLKKLLYNPLTYIIIFCFIAFTDIYYFIGQKFFTEFGSTSMNLFFSGFPYSYIIIVPALCSILFFTEQEYSFPVKTSVIAASKIIAVSSVLIIASILTIPVPVTVSFFGNTGFAETLCSYLGIFLFIPAVVSINIFVLIFTQSQGLAFLTGAVLMAVVNASHLAALYFNLPPFIAGLVKSISFAWHFDSFGKGIISSKEILFFVITALFFIFLTAAVMEKKRGIRNKKFTKKFVLTALIFVFLFADNYVLNFKIDATKEKRFSVSDYSKTILEQIEEPLNITYYRTASLKQLYPQVKDVNDFLELYRSFNKKINLKTVDPIKENLTDKLLNFGIYPEQIQTSGRDKTSFTQVYSAIVLEYIDKVEIIPFVLDTVSLEYSLTSRINVMVNESQKKIQIVYGSDYSSEDYSYVVPWLESQGFSVINADIPSEKTGNSFADNKLPLLVFGTSAFTDEDTEELENLILSGCPTFISTTPYSIDIANDWSVVYKNDKVVRLLKSWDLNLSRSITADISNFRLTMVSDSTNEGKPVSDYRTQYVNYPLWPVIQKQKNVPNGMTLFWPSEINIPDIELTQNKGYRIEPLVFTTQKSWQFKDTDGFINTNPFTIEKAPETAENYSQSVLCARAEGQLPGFYNTGKGTDCKVTVLGDQYAFTTLMTNYASGEAGDFRVYDFLTDRVLEMTGNSQLIPLKNKNYVSNTIYKVSKDKLPLLKYKVIVLTLLPGFLLVLLFIIFLYIKRKNKKNGYR